MEFKDPREATQGRPFFFEATRQMEIDMLLTAKARRQDPQIDPMLQTLEADPDFAFDLDEVVLLAIRE